MLLFTLRLTDSCSKNTENISQYSESVCGIVRKIFYTFFLTHLKELKQKENEKEKEKDNTVTSKRKIEHKTDTYMRCTAMNAVRYVLTTMNNTKTISPTKSLTHINSFLCFLPCAKITEICSQPDLAVAVAEDLSTDYGVIVSCINAAIGVLEYNNVKYVTENEVEKEVVNELATVGGKKVVSNVEKEVVKDVVNQVEEEVERGSADVSRCAEEASMLLALLANKVRHICVCVLV